MKEKAATLHIHHFEELDQAPHVLAQLLDLLNGTLHLSITRRRQIGQHLASCLPCQVCAAMALLAVVEDARARGEPVERIQRLLTCLLRITHAAFKEEIPAYVDTLIEQGEREARARFPWLTEHVRICQDCEEEVHDLRSWLAQLKET